MPKNRKPDNADKPSKPDIIIHLGNDRIELNLPPEMDANQVAADINAILHPPESKDQTL